MIAASPKKKAMMPRTVIFRESSESTIVACDGKVEEDKVMPLPNEELVDTNSTGDDTFVGGFLTGLLEKKKMASCVKAGDGDGAARFIIQQSGYTLIKACEYKL